MRSRLFPCRGRVRIAPRRLVCLSLMVLGLGCGKAPEAIVTDELAASFEGSAAQETVMAAETAFEESRYKDSLLLLHKVAGHPDLTDRQKKALGGMAGQIMQAVHNDPKLSTDAQLHRSMELLILRTMGAP